ncbi:succinate-semialdehyde dehydrogenase/glutarate-semialdehyde dehydrogenase [Curtobacterium sp. PhB171]|nr:succinate-semialdehyde dehydrogenase/glutarate-semialdehyde dehydrogenase [Curtobacterium sp. PhB171]ROQ27874.1 succinate-semialdehyde dehydrogenase/glutarate-semialdehyde dehydrogenase [Curtobacterium sp. PhB170]ROS34804.1 succinate-semialdehyde dehydrogenase/glutarate-semialdehyde dehydrogenase [Curtobacterium sp. PhB131]ROS72829.1 succinate-semialdehyde dehydrogenase/glutarate-semialdehyde dehydrogenase [Curtobacterium sp. PhB141]
MTETNTDTSTETDTGKSGTAGDLTATVGDDHVTVHGVPTGLFIGGSWRPSASGATFAVRDPSTGDVLAEVADATPEDGIAALDAAVAAQQEWAATAPRQRSDLLRRAFDLVRAHEDDLAALMTLEMGKPLAEARGEVVYGGEFLRWFSEEAVRIGGARTNPEGTGRAIVLKRPVGPVYAITPWNFPLAMATRKIGPALAAGCTVVVKPADLTPLTTLFLVELFRRAGLPDGVLNVVPSLDAKGLSEPIIADRRLRKLTFTGSTPVGSALLKQAADNVLKTSMELGGNAPLLVFDDADLDAAVTAAMLAKFRNVGEACTAANRFFVQEGIADAFVAALTAKVDALRIGRGTEDGTTMGPLIDDRAVDKAAGLVDDAVTRGARLVTGGHRVERPGTYYSPTVLDDVQPGSEILTTEIFGPVVSITRFATEDEGIRLANDTEFGLIAYAFTTDFPRGQRLAERLETGMLGLNTGVVSNAAFPFGGVKSSGLGREGSHEGIEEYLETVYVLTPDPFAA